MNLTNKVALITGSAKRVGKALALGLAEQGCHIVVHYGGSVEAAEDTAAEIKAVAVEAWAIQADLADEAAVRDLIPAILDRAGRLDILVNNASVFSPEYFLTADSTNWDQTMMVNLKTPFLLSQAFANQLPSDRQGKIINLLDSDSMRPKNHHFTYTISKVGLEGLTKIAAQALAERNIQVNGIALGAILPSSDDENSGVFDRLVKKIPARRPGDLQEVVDALIYLVQKADYVTGEIIRVDGGWHLV
jgi:NAD(P)-dependent dehydrogenase (short-subunit alcohol dehydrogenase family)